MNIGIYIAVAFYVPVGVWLYYAYSRRRKAHEHEPFELLLFHVFIGLFSRRYWVAEHRRWTDANNIYNDGPRLRAISDPIFVCYLGFLFVNTYVLAIAVLDDLVPQAMAHWYARFSPLVDLVSHGTKTIDGYRRDFTLLHYDHRIGPVTHLYAVIYTVSLLCSLTMAVAPESRIRFYFANTALLAYVPAAVAVALLAVMIMVGLVVAYWLGFLTLTEMRLVDDFGRLRELRGYRGVTFPVHDSNVAMFVYSVLLPLVWFCGVAFPALALRLLVTYFLSAKEFRIAGIEWGGPLKPQPPVETDPVDK